MRASVLLETQTMNPMRGIEALSKVFGVEPDHVSRALRFAIQNRSKIRSRMSGLLAEDQLQRLLGDDRHTLALVGDLAMRFAGRPDDGRVLMAVYKASVGATAHRPITRRGVGALPEHHNHEYVQQAIHILKAAELPPLHTDGTDALQPGFQVGPAGDDLPGWVFIHPDPAADCRSGFTGGRLGYLAVMRWAGWGIVTEPLAQNLLAVCHPDHRNRPLPSGEVNPT